MAGRSPALLMKRAPLCSVVWIVRCFFEGKEEEEEEEEEDEEKRG